MWVFRLGTLVGGLLVRSREWQERLKEARSEEAWLGQQRAKATLVHVIKGTCGPRGQRYP